jgi:hypothetical protein
MYAVRRTGRTEFGYRVSAVRRRVDEPLDRCVVTQIGDRDGRFATGVFDHPQRLRAVADIGENGSWRLPEEPMVMG